MPRNIFHLLHNLIRGVYMHSFSSMGMNESSPISDSEISVWTLNLYVNLYVYVGLFHIYTTPLNLNFIQIEFNQIDWGVYMKDCLTN